MSNLIINKLEELFNKFLERLKEQSKNVDELDKKIKNIENVAKNLENVYKELEKSLNFWSQFSLEENKKNIEKILIKLKANEDFFDAFLKSKIEELENLLKVKEELIEEKIKEELGKIKEELKKIKKTVFLSVPIGSKSYVDVYKDEVKRGTSDALNFTGSGVSNVSYNTLTKRIDINISGGSIGGSISANQVAFGTGNNTIGGDNNFWWNNTNKRLGLRNNNPDAMLRLDVPSNETGIKIVSNDSNTPQIIFNASTIEGWRIRVNPIDGRLYFAPPDGVGDRIFHFILPTSNYLSFVDVQSPLGAVARFRGDRVSYFWGTVSFDNKSVFDSDGYGFVKTATFLLALGTPATVGQNKTNELIIPRNGKIVKAFAYAKTAPQGSDLIFDININNTSIWNVNQNNRLKIQSGQNSGTQTNFDTTNVSEGQRLTIDIDQVGSTTAGQDITVELLMLLRNQ